jgi:hypothetical protein
MAVSIDINEFDINKVTPYKLRKYVDDVVDNVNSYKVVEKIMQTTTPDKTPLLFEKDRENVTKLRGTNIYAKRVKMSPEQYTMMERLNSLKPIIPTFEYAYSQNFVEYHPSSINLKTMIDSYNSAQNPENTEIMKEILVQIQIANSYVEREGKSLYINDNESYVVKFNTPKLICFNGLSFFTHFVLIIPYTCVKEGNFYSFSLSLFPRKLINETPFFSLYSFSNIEPSYFCKEKENFDMDEVNRIISEIQKDRPENEGELEECSSYPWKDGDMFTGKNIDLLHCMKKNKNGCFLVPEGTIFYVNDERIFKRNSYFPTDRKDYQDLPIVSNKSSNVNAVYKTTENFYVVDPFDKRIILNMFQTKGLESDITDVLNDILAKSNEPEVSIDTFKNYLQQNENIVDFGRKLEQFFLKSQKYKEVKGVVLYDNSEKENVNFIHEVKFYFFANNIPFGGKNKTPLLKRQFFNGNDWQVIKTILKKEDFYLLIKKKEEKRKKEEEYNPFFPSDIDIDIDIDRQFFEYSLNYQEEQDYSKAVWSAFFAKYFTETGDYGNFSDVQKKFIEATAFLMKIFEDEKFDPEYYAKLGLYEINLGLNKKVKEEAIGVKKFVNDNYAIIWELVDNLKDIMKEKEIHRKKIEKIFNDLEEKIIDTEKYVKIIDIFIIGVLICLSLYYSEYGYNVPQPQIPNIQNNLWLKNISLNLVLEYCGYVSNMPLYAQTESEGRIHFSKEKVLQYLREYKIFINKKNIPSFNPVYEKINKYQDSLKVYILERKIIEKPLFFTQVVEKLFGKTQKISTELSSPLKGFIAPLTEKKPFNILDVMRYVVCNCENINCLFPLNHGFIDGFISVLDEEIIFNDDFPVCEMFYVVMNTSSSSRYFFHIFEKSDETSIFLLDKEKRKMSLIYPFGYLDYPEWIEEKYTEICTKIGVEKDEIRQKDFKLKINEKDKKDNKGFYRCVNIVYLWDIIISDKKISEILEIEHIGNAALTIQERIGILTDEKKQMERENIETQINPFLYTDFSNDTRKNMSIEITVVDNTNEKRERKKREKRGRGWEEEEEERREEEGGKILDLEYNERYRNIKSIINKHFFSITLKKIPYDRKNVFDKPLLKVDSTIYNVYVFIITYRGKEIIDCLEEYSSSENRLKTEEENKLKNYLEKIEDNYSKVVQKQQFKNCSDVEEVEREISEIKQQIFNASVRGMETKNMHNKMKQFIKTRKEKEEICLPYKIAFKRIMLFKTKIEEINKMLKIIPKKIIKEVKKIIQSRIENLKNLSKEELFDAFVKIGKFIKDSYGYEISIEIIRSYVFSCLVDFITNKIDFSH